MSKVNLSNRLEDIPMKRNLIFLFSFLFLLLSTTSSQAFFNSDVKKAKEFMKAGMYPQAISLLEKRVNDKPTDAEAHYELGVCYINTGNFRGADQRFDSAVRLESDYGFSIGSEYQKAGKLSLEKNQSKNADRLFLRAIKYNPALKNESVKVTHEYGLKLLQFAKKKPKAKRRKYVNEAKKHVTQKDIDAVLPPATLQVTYKKEFIDNGFGWKKWVETAEFGKDFVNGDIVTIMGNHFLVGTNDGRKGPENGKRDIKIENCGPGHLFVENPKGKKFTVIVKKYITSY